MVKRLKYVNRITDLKFPPFFFFFYDYSLTTVHLLTMESIGHFDTIVKSSPQDLGTTNYKYRPIHSHSYYVLISAGTRRWITHRCMIWSCKQHRDKNEWTCVSHDNIYAYFWLLTSLTWGFLFTMPTETMEKHRLVATLNSPRRKGLTRSYTHKGTKTYILRLRCCIILVAGGEKGVYSHKHLRRICSRRPRTGGCSTVRKA